jgi:hypothetical protein
VTPGAAAQLNLDGTNILLVVLSIRNAGGASIGALIAMTGIIERAYEIAASGKVARVSLIESVLAEEGYAAVRAHLGSMTLRAELQRICRQAQGRRPRSGNPKLPADQPPLSSARVV